MKKSHFKTVVFIKDFATKKKGDEFSCDGQLATSLIEQGVAKYKVQDTTVLKKDEGAPAPKPTKRK